MNVSPTSVHETTSTARLATAALNLLHATENAATRGDFDLARTYARKASEAMDRLRAAASVRRITKAESQHGRLM